MKLQEQYNRLFKGKPRSNDSSLLKENKLVDTGNVKQLKIKEKSYIFEVKIISFFNQLNKNNKYEIIFFDPPFSETFFIEELKLLKNSNAYNDNHIIVIHREKNSKDDLSGIMNIITIKKYGRSKMIFGNFNLDIV